MCCFSSCMEKEVIDLRPVMLPDAYPKTIRKVTIQEKSFIPETIDVRTLQAFKTKTPTPDQVALKRIARLRFIKVVK